MTETQKLQKRTQETDFSESEFVATSGKTTVVFFSNERAGYYNSVSYFGKQAQEAAQVAYLAGLAVHQVEDNRIDHAMSPKSLTVTAVYQK